MALPDSYTLKTGAIPAYFDAVLDARPPERFSAKFLEQLGFEAANDRLFVGILNDLGFLDADGAPTERYFAFLDRSRSKHVVAEGIRDAYSDLFGVNTSANELSLTDVKNKLRTLYAGNKTDLVITNISKTFKSLCDYADFSSPFTLQSSDHKQSQPESSRKSFEPTTVDGHALAEKTPTESPERLKVRALEYHINIVLPDTRDQAVFDAIFKSLREHLG